MPERSSAAGGPGAAGEERWKIYKRTGEWDDVIEGPDTDETIVVPASLAAFLADDRDRYFNRAEAAEAALASGPQDAGLTREEIEWVLRWMPIGPFARKRVQELQDSTRTKLRSLLAASPRGDGGEDNG